jgi:hypothetical protein
VRSFILKAITLASFVSFSLLVGANPTSATPVIPERLFTCVRFTWESRDKCKEPAVASKKAPKNLKKEIERLASLIATSSKAARAEKASHDKANKAAYGRWQMQSSNHAAKQKAKQIACYKSLGLNYERDHNRRPWPEKCLQIWELGPSQPYPRTDGPKRKEWVNAWLSLITLAKTFPQHIQPTVLPTLLNASDNTKACLNDPFCYPTG